MLNVNHTKGGSKAKLLLHFGFDINGINALHDAIILHAMENEVKYIQYFEDTEERYIIEGPLHTPVKRDINMRCIWYRGLPKKIINFVTLYPI